MFKISAFAFAVLVAGVLCSAPVAQPQVAVGVNIGPAPVCPYGYFDYAPYDCAPYGYYGPDWFVGGVFIGAGPWFHGPANFRGHVDNHFDVARGYKGPAPNKGDKPEPANRLDKIPHFKGNEVRDGHGHTGK